MAEAKHTPVDLDALEKVAQEAAMAAPGTWESDNVDGEDGHGRYKAYAVFAGPDDQPQSIVDTHNSDIACIHIEFDEDGAHRWDEPGRVVCGHIATFDPPTALRLIETARALRDVAQTGRDYAKDLADGHLVSVKVEGRNTTISELREMGAADLTRFDTALAGQPLPLRAGDADLLDALRDAYRFISQPQRMETPSGGPKTATYRIEGYNALTAKIRTAIAKAEGR